MRTLVKLLLVFLFSAGLFLTSLNAQEASPENVKATFIYNFTNYINWENPTSDSVFSIVIFGASKVSKPLKYIASVKKVGSKRIKIIQAEKQSDLLKCDLLYVPAEQINCLTKFKQDFPENNTLIITNSASGLESGAMINFIDKEGKIGFEINQKLMQEKGLKVSSRLLKIADKVI